MIKAFMRDYKQEDTVIDKEHTMICCNHREGIYSKMCLYGG